MPVDNVEPKVRSQPNPASNMRLLNVDNRQLDEFFGTGIPPYAILSHTWGKEEVTFHDLQDPTHKNKLGYAKIEGACRLAAHDNLKWLWVDTCCIDKSGSAELSEGESTPSLLDVLNNSSQIQPSTPCLIGTRNQ